jgi:hypothetical protein
MSPPIHSVLGMLRVLRRRLRLQIFVGQLSRWTLVAGAGLLGLGAFNRWVAGRMPWDSSAGWFALGAVLVFSLGTTLFRRLTLEDAARFADREALTRDRFLTALALGQGGGPMEALAVEECCAFLKSRQRDFEKLAPLRWPQGIQWIAVAAVALGLLQWDAFSGRERQSARLRAAQDEVAGPVQTLEKWSRQLEERAEREKDEALKKLAEKLKQSAAQLRAEAVEPEVAAKAALKKLSTLEQWVQDLQKAAPPASPEELKELAKELAKNEATREAAAALEAGNLAKAAEALEEKQKEGGATAEQARETLQKALERLAQKRQLSEALQQLTREMQKAAGQGQQQSEALQRLAQMLRDMARKSGSQGAPNQQGQQPSEQTLKDLLAALQNMKYGSDSPGQKPSGQQGQQGRVAMESFAQGAPGGGQPLPIPSGQPGSERDTGTTDTPFGDKTAVSGEKAKDTALQGALAEGETLSTLMPALGDSSKSTRRYQQIYEAMAPAAQDALLQEEIPLGSRFFIKRYFESIRP